MPVDYRHKHYDEHERKAQRVRDAVSGSDAVKRKGELYLPCPGGPLRNLRGDEYTKAESRYEAYIGRASWVGVTSRTHEGFLGAIFRKEPQVDLPPSLDYMKQDADGSGMSLNQFGKVLCSNLMIEGRDGVLVDYPEADDGLTREQTQGLKATLRFYSSSSIINWRREGERLTLIVLHETYEDQVDDFQAECKDQYRVLSLENDVYTQSVYRDGVIVEGSTVQPKDASGSTWNVIPFQFFGSVVNDENPDKPLLLDIADLNLGHYRNSADLEESSFITGQPMLHIDIGENTTAEEWDTLNPNGITVGSRRGIQTKGGSISMVQAEPNNLPKELMADKERQMLSIGAKLIEQSGSNETAEAVKARSGAETSNLSTIADNVSDGIENCLEWCARFMDRNAEAAAEKVVFVLNKQFYPETTDPQMIMARIAELDRGLIAKKDYRDWRRKGDGIDADRTDEMIEAEAQAGGTDIGVV